MTEFSTLGLSQPLLDAIAALGFEHPTPIQEKAIPRLLQADTDFVGLAQTGTGKTAAFGLPLMDLIDPEVRPTQALVLAPTRELCLQIAKELTLFGQNKKRIKVRAVYGGANILNQIREVRQGAHIVVATPGRLRDMMRRKAVDLRELSIVVLDEADEMLNMGFKEEIDDILRDTPEEKLTWLFSATMPHEVRRIAQNYMSNPFELSIGKQNSANADIEHQYIYVKNSMKYEALTRFLDADPNLFGLVFCRTRRDTQKLAKQLSKDGYKADAIHGDLSQSQRDAVMDKFRTHRIQILVATDVAARGIDVQDISHVFHFNIPDDMAFYTHRSGRTGRAGKKGISLVLAHPRDRRMLRDLERRIQSRFTEARLPDGEMICRSRIQSYFQNLKASAVNEDIDRFMPEIEAELADWTKEDLIRHLASSKFSRLLKTHLRKTNDAPDLDFDYKKIKGRSLRLFINIGTMDVDGKSGFLSFLSDHCD
ncbi:MAG: DEAD/DEAH box helicase, partial [Bacteroidota bacterium]